MFWHSAIFLALSILLALCILFGVLYSSLGIYSIFFFTIFSALNYSCVHSFNTLTNLVCTVSALNYSCVHIVSTFNYSSVHIFSTFNYFRMHSFSTFTHSNLHHFSTSFGSALSLALFALFQHLSTTTFSTIFSLLNPLLRLLQHLSFYHAISTIPSTELPLSPTSALIRYLLFNHLQALLIKHSPCHTSVQLAPSTTLALLHDCFHCYLLSSAIFHIWVVLIQALPFHWVVIIHIRWSTHLAVN